MVGLLRDLLAIDPGIDLVGRSTNARTAIHDIAALAPDVAIVDIALEDSSGFDVLKALARNPADTQPVRIVLSNFATDRYRAEAKKLGADHFFDKSGEILDLLRTLTAIGEHDGRRSDSLI